MLFVPLHSFLTERDNDNLLYLKLGGKKDIRSLYSSDLKQTHGEVRRWLLNNQTHQLANLAFINHRQQNTKGGGETNCHKQSLLSLKLKHISPFRSIPSERRESGYLPIFFYFSGQPLYTQYLGLPQKLNFIFTA